MALIADSNVYPSTLGLAIRPNRQRRQVIDQRHRRQTHPDHLADQAHNVLGIGGVVGVVDNAAAFVNAHLVLVDHPFKRRTVAQLVRINFGRNASQGEKLVVDQARLILVQLHAFDAPVERLLRVFDKVEAIFGLPFTAFNASGVAQR